MRVLGENAVDDAVQQDIQEQKALEEKRQMEQMPTGSIHERLDWGADGTSEPSRSGGQRAGGNLGKTDGGKTGCDGTNENAGSDEMGWFNE